MRTVSRGEASLPSRNVPRTMGLSNSHSARERPLALPAATSHAQYHSSGHPLRAPRAMKILLWWGESPTRAARAYQLLGCPLHTWLVSTLAPPQATNHEHFQSNVHTLHFRWL